MWMCVHGCVCLTSNLSNTCTICACILSQAPYEAHNMSYAWLLLIWRGSIFTTLCTIIGSYTVYTEKFKQIEIPKKFKQNVNWWFKPWVYSQQKQNYMIQHFISLLKIYNSFYFGTKVCRFIAQAIKVK